MTNKRALWVTAIIVFTGCTTYATKQLEVRYGSPAPRDRTVATVPPGDVDFWHDVKPVVDSRCVVCHGCYDAPCQLKMSSIEGIERGASPEVVYNQARIKQAQTTRLFEDAQTVSGWRKLGFHPVLNEYSDALDANRNGSVMYRILQLKTKNPLPGNKLPDGDYDPSLDRQVLADNFDLSLNRKEFCAKPDTFEDYARKNPLWGMPYGVPGLDGRRQQTLLHWLEQGATYTARPPLSKAFQNEIRDWETFLNDDSLKAQLMSRYIYEHLFLAHLYFTDRDERVYFSLVRSRTAPGEPVDRIATRRPFDDPGVERVYYRIVEYPATIVAKTHMPYAFNSARLARWQELFIDADYTVTALPSYDPKTASNPFLTFDELPVNSRYRFMLEEAQFTIMSFIKGPVCRGQVALNVINDHFWVFFIDPSDQKTELVEEFLASKSESIKLPAAKGSVYNPIRYWRSSAKQQKKLLGWFDEYLTANLSGKDDMSLDKFWDGDGTNDNAALTIFRHFDNATVEKGLVGAPPKTAWLIGYPLLERIHYLLVAGYDVFGNVGHQLVTRTYMDFLRMEGETAFLLFLPQEARNRERAYWYREADEEVMEFLTLPRFESESVPAIDYQTNDEKIELFDLLKQRLAPVLSTKHQLDALGSPAISAALKPLNSVVGLPVTLMPQTIFVQINGADGARFVSLIRVNAHLNITSMFGEKKFRIPEEDRLETIPGFLGAYPNVFFVVEEADLNSFVSTISTLRTEDDYSSLLDTYGVRRTSPRFWQQSDIFHSAYQLDEPIEFGLFDYNRLENR